MPKTRTADEAIDLFEQHSSEWVKRLQAAMVKLANERGTRGLPVSGDDAVQWLDREGYRGDYRLVGAVFRRTTWVCVGHAPSTLGRRHHRPIALWTLPAHETLVRGYEMVRRR